MYRFLLRPRWILAALLTVAAALVMVRLGEWQLHRYEERHAINARIDAADTTQAVAMTSVMARPTSAGAAGPSPGNAVAWTKVTVTGTYDSTHETQARGRTVDGDVGFEIVTPLQLTDGTAVLVDRGWVPAPDAGALAAPTVPAAPAGQVTVVGQIHLSESRPTPIEHRDGRLDTRRISVPRLAHEMPYPVYGAYVLLTEQTPANDKAFSQIPIDHEDDWQNAGYTVQWWLFAVMTLFAYGFQARKEAQLLAGVTGDTAISSGDPSDMPSPAGEPLDRVAAADRKRAAEPMDRVEAADRKRAAAAEPMDRVEAADRKRAAAKAKRAADDEPMDRVAAADLKKAAAHADKSD